MTHAGDPAETSPMKNAFIIALPSSLLLAILLGPTFPAAFGIGEGGISLLMYYAASAVFWGIVLQFASLLQQKGLGTLVFIAAIVSVVMVIAIAATPFGALIFGVPGGIIATAGYSPLWVFPAATALIFISLMSSLIGAVSDQKAATA